MEQWQADLQNALAARGGLSVRSDGETEDYNRELNEQNDRFEEKLIRVADILAANGIIHNTPHAKRQWIESEDGGRT